TFEFFLVKLRRDEDFAADQAAFRVDQLIDRQRRHAPVLRICRDCAPEGVIRPGALPPGRQLFASRDEGALIPQPNGWGPGQSPGLIDLTSILAVRPLP